MTMKLKQLGVLALVAWCLKASILTAQTKVPVLPEQTATPASIVVTDIAEPAPATNRPLQRVLNSHGMACASDFNRLGCGNFCSEFKFVFGSCRTFFGQTCEPSQPHFGQGNGGFQRGCGN
jgi:hypothetical protein